MNAETLYPFVVTLEVPIVVVAKNKERAEEVACETAEQELGNEPLAIAKVEWLKPGTRAFKVYREDCPFGVDDDDLRTVEEWARDGGVE